MPMFIYRCQSCSHQFELSQQLGDVPVQDCPRCQHRVRRVLLPTSIILRGEGPYVAEVLGGAGHKPKKTEVDA